jgi:hypothetical protein
MEPILGAILGNVAGNIAGGLFGGLFGGRRRTPQATYNPAEEIQRQQSLLMQELQRKAMQEDLENKSRYFKTLPLLQTAVRSALGGLGFTEQGVDLGIRRLPFFGLLMRQAQAQADQIKAQLIRRGVDPATAEAVAQRQLYEAEQEATMQGEAQNQQRLLQAVQLMGTLLGASQYNPALLPQVLGSAQQAWATATQANLQQQQLAQQMKLAEEQQRQAFFSNIGQLAGLYFSGAFNNNNKK